MNYYEHHLGDWAAATGHLTWDEDMAYTRLIRAYYHAERAIQDGQQYRLAKAITAAQKRAVDAVLAEFFELVDSHHHQKRADAEISRFIDKQRKARASANARWTNTERNANASPNAMRTHSEGNALQTPDTKHQKEKDGEPSTGVACAIESENEEPDDDPPPNDAPQPTPYGAVCKAMRQAGLGDANPGNLKFRTLVDQGATTEEFVAAAAEAVRLEKPFAWALGAVIGRRRDAAAVKLAPAAAAPSRVVETWKPEAPMTDAEREANNAKRLAVMANLPGNFRLKQVAK